MVRLCDMAPSCVRNDSVIRDVNSVYVQHE